jgi:hypothetical protein
MKPETNDRGIRCADHATPSICKSRHYFANKPRLLVRHSSLEDQSHGVFFYVTYAASNDVIVGGIYVSAFIQAHIWAVASRIIGNVCIQFRIKCVQLLCKDLFVHLCLFNVHVALWSNFQQYRVMFAAEGFDICTSVEWGLCLCSGNVSEELEGNS